jgi:hypothetical protein
MMQLMPATEEQDDSMNASLTLSFAPMNPGRVLLMDELNNGRPSLHFHDEDDIDHSKGGPQRAELWENLFCMFTVL